MPSAKWEDMKQMKRLTNRHIVKIIMWSLPVAILAAIAFIMTPSIHPESYDGMKRSVVMIECREYYEIVCNGKVIAYCDDIKSDSTLNIVKTEADSDTERKAMVCGCWINKFSFIPSCHGRILTANPFSNNDNLLSMANNDPENIIEKTIAKHEEMFAADKKREAELNYYLDTHNVKDDGYNTIAAYAEENKRKKESLLNSIDILKSLQKEKKIKIRKRNKYALLYPTTTRKTGRVFCHLLAEESEDAPKGTIVLQTENEFMPEDANSLYTFKVFCLIPEKGDSITIAGIFGLTEKSTSNAALQKPNVFKGATISTERHDTPPLLAPNGAPIFNRNGFFIGINNKGGIAQ